MMVTHKSFIRDLIASYGMDKNEIYSDFIHSDTSKEYGNFVAKRGIQQITIYLPLRYPVRVVMDKLYLSKDGEPKYFSVKRFSNELGYYLFIFLHEFHHCLCYNKKVEHTDSEAEAWNYAMVQYKKFQRSFK